MNEVDPRDPLWAKLLGDDHEAGQRGGEVEEEEDDDDEIIPPRVHRKGAQALVCASPRVSCVLVRWGPSQETDVHRHCERCEGCAAWTLVLDGRLEVSRHGSGESPAKAPEATALLGRAAGPVRDAEGPRGEWHKVRNASARETALVLHVFAPLSLATCLSSADRNQALRLAPVDDLDALSEVIQGLVSAAPGPASPETALVRNYLQHIEISPEERRRFYSVSRDRYTRNLICHNAKFTMLILCWSGGQQSPIHDHSGSACFVKVLEGKLTETRYAYPAEEDADREVPLRETALATFSPGAVTYIDDSLGLHKMANPSAEDLCATLHIYSPPYSSAKIFNLANSGATRVPMVIAPRSVPHLSHDAKHSTL